MKTVIKLAGALLEDDVAVRSLARQIAALAQQGHEILVVHGGGRLFTATLKRMGIESNFVAGLRVTNRETRDVAVMVFAGLLKSAWPPPFPQKAPRPSAFPPPTPLASAPNPWCTTKLRAASVSSATSPA